MGVGVNLVNYHINDINRIIYAYIIYQISLEIGGLPFSTYTILHAICNVIRNGNV